MSKKKFYPQVPHIELPDPEVMEKIKNTNHKDFKKTKAYKQAVLPAIKRDNKRKRSIKLEWWKNHWIDLAALVISIISLIVSLFCN